MVKIVHIIHEILWYYCWLMFDSCLSVCVQHVMKFDAAFDESCHNKDVYDAALRPLVTSVCDK